MPQFDGLFDYQNRVRPSFFAFKLLSRMTGDRLPVVSSDPAVHGLATQDDEARIAQVLLWNFSDSPAEVDLTVRGLPREMRLREITLDALAPSDDENVRLRPSPSRGIEKGDHRVRVTLEPYAVWFWSFE